MLFPLLGSNFTLAGVPHEGGSSVRARTIATSLDINIQLELSTHLAGLGQCHVPPLCFLQGPAIPGGSRGIDGGQVGQVQDPEELAQELSASRARCVPGSWVGGQLAGGGGGGSYVSARGGVVYSSGILGVHLCTCGNTVGRWVGRRKTGLAVAVSPSLFTPAPGPWACGSSCSFFGRSWHRWLRRGEPGALRAPH